MSFGLVLPGLVVVAISAAAGTVRWRLSPMVLVRLLSAIAAVAASTTMMILLAGVVGFVSRSPIVGSLLEWCGLVVDRHTVTVGEGLLALLLAAAIFVRVWRVVSLRRKAAEGMRGRRFAVLDTAEPIAYAAPGSPGCVVVSRGLLDSLARRERQVVIAHERAHLDLGHHRYLLVGEVSRAVLPILGPLVAQLRLATERSADETAATVIGGDRRLVATTIARAAVTTSAFRGVVGSLGGSSVPLRVEALVSPLAGVASRWIAMAAALTVVVVVGGSAQAHHLYRVIAHICSL